MYKYSITNIPYGSTYLGSGIFDILKNGSGTKYLFQQIKNLNSGCFRFQFIPGFDKLIILTDPQGLHAIPNGSSETARDVTEAAIVTFFAYPPEIRKAKDKSVHEARPFLLQDKFSSILRTSVRKYSYESIQHVIGSNQQEWKTFNDSLRCCQEIIFRTVTPSFFTEDLNNDETFSCFADFIDNFSEFLSPITKIKENFGYQSKGAIGREKFRSIMASYCDKNGIDNFTPLIQHTYKVMHETEGCENQSNHILSSIWALLPLAGAFMNTGPTFYWTFINVLTHPEAKIAVMNEIKTVLPWLFHEHDNLERLSEYNLSKSLPILDSCITESLRMTSGVFIVRGIEEDGIFEWNNHTKGIQGPYQIKKGESIIFPSPIVHMDPEIFPEPETFQYDRFLTKDNQPKKFLKDGVPVRLLAFGDGKVICPGRFLARELILTIIVQLLTQYDIKIDESLPKPIINPWEFGQGIMNPNDRNYPIQFRKKNPTSNHHIPLRRCSSH